MAASSGSWADVATIGHYKHQRRIIEQQMQNNSSEMEVTEKCSDPIVKPYTTGTDKSKSHGLMVTLGKCTQKGKGKSTTERSETNEELVQPSEIQLNDFLTKSLDKLKKAQGSSKPKDENQNDFQKAMDDMFGQSHNPYSVLSQNFQQRSGEVELDLEKEFPTLGGGSKTENENDGIVLGSSSFYQMKRNAEKAQKSDESHKKILKMYDGSLYFGDEPNVGTNDLKYDLTDIVEDDTFQLDKSADYSDSENQDYGRPEWENEESDIYKPIDSMMMEYSKCDNVPQEVSRKNTDFCDNEKQFGAKEHGQSFRDIKKDTNKCDTEEKGIIWGIDSSLVNVPRCPFDLNILPETWLTADLQGWIPGEKVTRKAQSDIESKNNQIIPSAGDNLQTTATQNENMDEQSYTKSDVETHLEMDKHESGIDSNAEVASDIDHGEKAYGRKPRRIVGSTDDSNRSSPPSDSSNVSSDSEEECDIPSGPPSIAEFNYDTDDLAGTQGTWGSRCPSPEPEENSDSYSVPISSDLFDCSKQPTSKESPNSEAKGEELKSEKVHEKEKELDVALEKKDCDTLENNKDLNTNETVGTDQFGEAEGPVEKKNEIETKEIVPSLLERNNIEPAVFESEDKISKEKSPERMERKTLTPRSPIDSSSGPSRESSPYRPKQPYLGTSTSDSLDMSRTTDSPIKGNISPKLVRVRRKRRLPAKRRPENTEKSIETAETKLEAAEKITEDLKLPPPLPSMTLKNMTTLPLSDIIAIRRSMGPTIAGFSSSLTKTEKTDPVVHKVSERIASPKVSIPKETGYGGNLRDASPSRLDEYSTWDNGGWSPFDITQQRESILDKRQQQLRTDNVINNDVVSVADTQSTQSDTDSGHWTAAHEDRSSHRSSPRVIPTPTREADDRLSVQSEETADGDTNSSTSESIIFSGSGFPRSSQASRAHSRNTTTSSNANQQQVPYQQFPNTLPTASSVPNIEQQQWFNMAMQCMAQQYMAQQMQLQMQMQQGCNYNPWMAQNQHSGNPIASFRCPPGFNNQVPADMGQAGIPNNPATVLTSQNSSEIASHAQARANSPHTISGSYYGGPQPQQTYLPQQDSARKPNSAFTVNPGTSITVDRPGHDFQDCARTAAPDQDSIKHIPEQVHANSCAQTGSVLKERKRQQPPKDVQEKISRPVTAKRCDEVKLRNVVEHETNDDASNDEVKNVVKVAKREMKSGVSAKRTKNPKESRKKEIMEDEQEEASAKRSNKKTKNKAKRATNTASRMETLRGYWDKHNETFVNVLQVLLMLSIAYVLYDLLHAWKTSSMR